MELKKDFYIDSYEVHCGEHGSRAEYLLKIDYGATLVPLCQTCVNELFEELVAHVSEETWNSVKDKRP